MFIPISGVLVSRSASISLNLFALKPLYIGVVSARLHSKRDVRVFRLRSFCILDLLVYMYGVFVWTLCRQVFAALLVFYVVWFVEWFVELWSF